MEYRLKKNEYGDIYGCDSCHAEVETAETSTSLGKKAYLCSLCCETFIGNAHFYPDQYSFVTPQMLAQATHWLLKELKK